jgi:SMP-30/Gluconolactonase/LRE-like region
LTTHATVSGKATGLTFTPDGTLLLSGWDQQDTPMIWQVSAQGNVDVLVTLPDALFLNGLTPLTDSLYLIADSYRGIIWQLNLPERTVQVWLEHPQLARSSPDQVFPAVNGLKIFDGILYASNTQKAQLVKIPIQPNQQPGEPEVFLNQVNLDDFAFDRQGNLYGTTHVFNSVVKIAPDGSMTTIAQLEQGMAGTTALAFGRSPSDQTCLYVTTNGGMSFPPISGIEPAKVVCLEVGIAGLPLL